MTQTQLEITVQPRTITGRKNRQLRAQGISPANIYGKMMDSTSVQVNTKHFMNLYSQAGETQVINLTIEGNKKTIPVLVSGIDLDPITDMPLHIDFRQVNLKEKINATIPVELVGESPAANLGGIVVQQVSEIEVEALPTELPDQFTLDISTLTEIDAMIQLQDLEYNREQVTIVDMDPETILVKVEAPMTEEEAADAVIDPEAVEITSEKPAEEESESNNQE